MAYDQLSVHGDPLLGEWTEDRPKAFHLRRRLREDEQAKVGPACDLRGTAEALQRFNAMVGIMHPASLYLAVEELRGTL